jgi:hypothetical protein
MQKSDKRKHNRLNTKNLSYICLDEDQRAVKQGMGRTLNISESGILLETHFPIEAAHTVILSLGLKNDLADIRAGPCTSAPLPRGSTRWGSNSWRWTTPPSAPSSATCARPRTRTTDPGRRDRYNYSG